MSEVEIKVEGFDENQFAKPSERKAIDSMRDAYFASGGTVKKFIPPFSAENFYHCDKFVPGLGSYQSAPGVVDTKVRVPRPEKKWKK